MCAVRDSALGRDVALKEVPRSALERLWSEFETLARFRHPHIVRVYDFFCESPLGADRCAYSMELAVGVSLREATLRDGRRDEVLLAALLRATEELLGGLVQLHAARVAHLDLKPDNVVVDASTGVKLMDFGIAAPMGVPLETLFGSRSYIAPELAVGKEVDARADLFGLGVMLAEAMLGSLSTARRLVSAPFEERKDTLSQAFGGLPDVEPLATLVASMMSESPSDRPASALKAASEFARARRRPFDLTPSMTSALIRSGGFIGRERELAEVISAMESPRVLVVSGSEGVGRRALFDRAISIAQRRGANIERLSRAQALPVFASMIERLCPGAAEVIEAEGRFDGSSPEAFESGLERYAERVGEWLMTQPPPGVGALVVTSLEESAAPVRSIISRLVSRPRPLPFGLIVRGENDHATLSLGPLPRTDIERFIDNRFGRDIALCDTFVALLAGVSGGHAATLERMCELLISRGILSLGADGWAIDEANLRAFQPPASFREVIDEMVAVRPEAERQILEVLGELDAPVTWRVLSAALEVDTTALESLLSAALVRHEDGRFELASFLRTRGHGPLRDSLKSRLSRCLNVERLPPSLEARLRGGEAGVNVLLGPIREAIAEFRLEDAGGLCALGLSLEAPPSEVLNALLSLRVDIADRLGPREAQRDALRQLSEALPEHDPRQLEARSRLFWTLTRMGDPEVEGQGRELLRQATLRGQKRLVAEVAVHLAIVHTQRGDWGEAESLLERAGAEVPLDMLGLRARIANNLGNVHHYRNELSSAAQAYEEALRLKREEGDPVGERIALGNLALMKLELGAPGEALDGLLRSLELARTTGHRRGEAWSLLTLAELGIESGAFEYAVRRARRAVEIASTLGDQLVEGDARTTLAEALWMLGRPHGEDASRGEVLARRAKNRWTETRARLLGLVLARGERDRDGAEVESGLEAILAEVEAEAGTRRLAARLLAERDLEAGEVARARGRLELLDPDPSDSTPKRLRPGSRLAAFEATRKRVDELAGRTFRPPEGVVTKIHYFVESLPEAPRVEVDDPPAEFDGPCRARALGLPEVKHLLGLLEVKHLLARPFRETRARGDLVDSHSSGVDERAPTALNVDRLIVDRGGSLSQLPDTFGTDAVLSDARVALTHALKAAVIALEAERLFVLRVHSEAEVLCACDADGEPISEPLKRLPEVALEAARKDQNWRAKAGEGRGAIAVWPWRLRAGSMELSGAVIAQNRFRDSAFEDLGRIRGELTPVLWATRLLILERALGEAEAAAEKARTTLRNVEREATAEISLLRKELESTRDQLGPSHQYSGILFKSGAMKRMLRQVDRVVTTDLPVHIHGESGTGKELVARAVHELGDRRLGPFVPQNCTAIPQTLFESELFGHERGAFTGAVRAADGLFRRAHKGTLFLDEIGDLPLELQAKLLRVLETGEVRPVGASKSVEVDVRIVSATHRDLADLIARGLFREDLFYRLNVIRIEVPPLRERPDDIPLLTRHFLQLRASKDRTYEVDEAAMKALLRYPWPGNVRQLENEVSRAALLCDDGLIRLSDLSPDIASPPKSSRTSEAGRPSRKGGGPTLADLSLDSGTLKDRVDRLEAHVLKEVLEASQQNKSEVARVLGLSRAGLNLKLKRLGLWDGEES